MLQVFALGAALTIAVLQTPSGEQAATDPGPHKPVVLTGCLTATAQDQGPRFMLINAGPAPLGAAARPPETGTTGVGTTGTGTSGSGASASPTTAQDTAQVTVVLTAAKNVRLQPHVDHRVEVEGPLTRPAGTAKADEPARMEVTAVRRVPGACSGERR